MTLLNHSTGQTLIAHLEVADTRATRNRGLLGRDELPATQALWIKRCNWVHTFFMKFTIDLVYLNQRMEVRKTVSRMRPFRIGMPVMSADSVIEFREGFLEKFPIKIGDKLHVDHTLS